MLLQVQKSPGNTVLKTWYIADSVLSMAACEILAVSGFFGTGCHIHYWLSQTSPKLACQENKNGNTPIRQCLVGKSEQHCTLGNAVLLEPLEDTY